MSRIIYNPICLLLFISILNTIQSKIINLSNPPKYFDCDSYVPTLSKRGRGCLHRLKTHHKDYSQCNNTSSNTTCYIFLQEPPFISIDPLIFNNSNQSLDLQKPFRCGEYQNAFQNYNTKLSGIAFTLHQLTTSRDDLCMWGGHADDCLFNELVDYIDVMGNEDNYRFGITGLLLEIPLRKCRHKPGYSYLDNRMIVIGRRNESTSTNSPWGRLTKPFHWGGWLIFGLILLLFALVCLAMACRFRIVKGRSLITAFFIFAGARHDALAYEKQMHGRGAAVKAQAFTTKYGLALSLYRFALLAYLGIFVLFYEVAVVNFLFQQQTVALTRHVQVLSKDELQHYSVLKNSALELVWNATVNLDGNKFDGVKKPPWTQSKTATQGIKDVRDKKTKYMVTFEVVGKYLLNKHSDCKELAIFDTRNELYKFHAGWLYNDRVNVSRRERVDKELVELQIKHITPEIIADASQEAVCESKQTSDIGPMIILIPCVVFVLPPLLTSIAVLFLWKKRISVPMRVPKCRRRRVSKLGRRPVLQNLQPSSTDVNTRDAVISTENFEAQQAISQDSWSTSSVSVVKV